MERILDPNFVESAENARSSGNNNLAIELTRRGLQIKNKPLTKLEINKISEDAQQKLILACLSRIYVDALKSQANSEILPFKAINPLEQAALAISVIYRDNKFILSLDDVEKDHLGRQHYFLPEMKRDEVKVLEAAAVLYPHRIRRELIGRAHEILEQTYLQLPPDHPTKPLIGIEKQLLWMRYGGAFSKTDLLDNFKTLVDNDLHSNPHRVATVACWLAVWGDKVKMQDLSRVGNEVFQRITGEHTEWGFIMEAEAKKVKLQAMRRKVFIILTPFTVNPNRTRDLHFFLTYASQDQFSL